MSINYQQYQEKALEKIVNGELPKSYKLMSEEEFNEWMKPIDETSALREQRDFVLAYEIAKKRLEKLLKGTKYEKDIMQIPF